MIRSVLLWASTNPTLAEKLPRMGFVRRAVRRFMPGEEPEDAFREAAKLQERGAGSLVTLLGEGVDDGEQARDVVDHYLKVLDDIRERGLDVEISVKPTQLGLDLGTRTALDHLRELARAAGDAMVWVDMEASGYVDATLDIYRAVRESRPNVGLCLQSYLRRTPEDLESLLPLEPAIRLVKGAYREPPEVAFPKKREVDAAYTKLSTQLLREAHLGRMGRVALGTHDERMINHAKTRAHELGMNPGAWEVEMLYGIATDLQGRLVRGGTNVRILISYGSHWFPWYMRRLAERPANIWFVVRKMIGR